MNRYNFSIGSIVVVVILVALCATAFVLIGTIPQDLSYHRYADQRTCGIIPNCFDVGSNLPFLIIGIAGVRLCLKHKPHLAPYSWLIFFFGISLVALGSVYYHWSPNNQTLMWDRLPMTISFMGLFIALLSETIHQDIEPRYLASAIFLGIASVLYWRFTDDLRFYGLVQFVPLLSIPVLVVVFGSKYSHQYYLLFGLIGYGLAKITEMYDKEVFRLSHELISGHSVKHLLAAGSVLWVYRMLRIRQPLFTPYSSQDR